MKYYNNLQDAVRELKVGVVFGSNGEKYRKETEMAIINLGTNKVLIRGLDF
jgi:hypothetical protein